MAGNLNVGIVNAAQLLQDSVGMFGVGQTWQNMLPSRSLDTTYTNTTGKTIFVAISVSSGSQWSTFQALVDGLGVAATCPHNYAGTPLFDCLFFPVGAGQTYRVTITANAGTLGAIMGWVEFK